MFRNCVCGEPFPCMGKVIVNFSAGTDKHPCYYYDFLLAQRCQASSWTCSHKARRTSRGKDEWAGGKTNSAPDGISNHRVSWGSRHGAVYDRLSGRKQNACCPATTFRQAQLDMGSVRKRKSTMKKSCYQCPVHCDELYMHCRVTIAVSDVEQRSTEIVRPSSVGLRAK